MESSTSFTFQYYKVSRLEFNTLLYKSEYVIIKHATE